MNILNNYRAFWTPDIFAAGCEYVVDSWQRSILFTDLLRKRGNQYFEHVRLGQPPVLVFDYEMVLDGRTLDNPANYSIVRIINRRSRASAKAPVTSGGQPQKGDKAPSERRSNGRGQLPEPLDSQKRPIVIIDPRAGQGPGIGGSKMDSQIGVALNAGHPVYFIMFYPEPEPGQTLATVQQAEIKFLEEVIRRHPEAEPPAVIGNCQAGWATALIGADRPDVTGPMVLNGSPLSYWGGVDGANPMRYRGGLLGGNWLTSLFCDLGNGTFDGAHLVYNFEQLNPSNTLWTKLYNVYSQVDTEEKRFLSFEKWWGGFFKMNREEIHFIVDSLFVGNELEQGHLRLAKDQWINLKNFKDPIVVFASTADRITPPQQALNWIYKVYRTVDEIKRNGQVIVYILHAEIGHLGIFVGSSVARKEHTAIIGTVDMIEYLSPGLYEMTVTGESRKEAAGSHKVEFAERSMEDILRMDDGLDDEQAFAPVAAVSRLNDKLYLTFISPWVRMMINEPTAELLRQLHPLRVERAWFSDRNPLFWSYQFLASCVQKNRQPIGERNPFLHLEKAFSAGVQSSLDAYRDQRDSFQQQFFKLIYENEWTKTIFPKTIPTATDPSRPIDAQQAEVQKKLWQEVMQRGDFVTAAVRVILIVASADGTIDQLELLRTQEIIQEHPRLLSVNPVDIKRLVREQAALIGHDREAAIKALSTLLPDMDDRAALLDIAVKIAHADFDLDQDEQDVLNTIRSVLEP